MIYTNFQVVDENMDPKRWLVKIVLSYSRQGRYIYIKLKKTLQKARIYLKILKEISNISISCGKTSEDLVSEYLSKDVRGNFWSKVHIFFKILLTKNGRTLSSAYFLSSWSPYWEFNIVQYYKGYFISSSKNSELLFFVA